MSNTWADRAAALIPAGTQTFSKARSQFPANAPTHIERGAGAHVWDTEGREFIDWTCGLGAISLGYNDPSVNVHVIEQLQKGTIFGLASPIEVEFAEELAPLLSWPDVQMRFGKNGSDATAGAVRAARAITGRDEVLSIGYHGYQDWCCPNKNGVPRAVWGLTVDDISDGVVPMMPDYACVIVEPDMVSDLGALRAACDETGTLLVFDEVLTGFRCPGFTYSKWKGVTPDLICLAKAVANGFPLSVIAGPEKHMAPFGGAIGYSFTFGGECLSLAAGLATIKKFKREPVIERLWAIGDRLRGGWELACQAYGLSVPLHGLSPRLVFDYPSLEMRTLISQEFIRRGILASVGFTACYAHTDADVDQTLVAISEIAELIGTDNPGRLIEGPVVSHPYRRMTP